MKLHFATDCFASPLALGSRIFNLATNYANYTNDLIREFKA